MTFTYPLYKRRVKVVWVQKKKKKEEQVWTSPNSPVIRAVTLAGKRHVPTSCSQGCSGIYMNHSSKKAWSADSHWLGTVVLWGRPSIITSEGKILGVVTAWREAHVNRDSRSLLRFPGRWVTPVESRSQSHTNSHLLDEEPSMSP